MSHKIAATGSTIPPLAHSSPPASPTPEPYTREELEALAGSVEKVTARLEAVGWMAGARIVRGMFATARAGLEDRERLAEIRDDLEAEARHLESEAAGPYARGPLRDVLRGVAARLIARCGTLYEIAHPNAGTESSGLPHKEEPTR